MTTAVQCLLESFDHLAESDKREFTLEVLRRAATDETSTLSEEELTLIAERQFLELDRAEAAS